MTKQPQISVLMTTYNRSTGLSKVIQNIFDQEFQSMEVVVVNDGSQDNTKEILNGLQEKYRLKVIHNSVNLGLQKSLNIGLSQCYGKYIARIDDHDLWIDSTKLSKQYSFLENHPDYSIVGTAYQLNGQKISNPLSDIDIRKQILFRSPFCHVSVLIRKSTLDQVGGYDESLPYSEDWDLWLKVGKEAKMKNLNDCMTYVHLDKKEASLSNNFFLKQMRLNQNIIRKHSKFYPKQRFALIYNKIVQTFFTIFPQDSVAHRIAHRLFVKTFHK